MARLKVDTDSMQTLERNLREWISDTANAMKAMRDEVAKLDESWEGSNHDTFVATFAERKDAVKAHATTLESFSESLTQATKLYMELEEEVAQVVSGL